MIQILLIDDDEKLAALLKQYLDGFGFTVVAHATPESALRALRDTEPDVVVLDVMLPRMDGFAVLRRIREKSTVPVVMLTARGDVADRIIGLESGADDYLPKPFEPRELVARIHAVLRRKAAPATADVRRFGRLEIDRAGRRVTVDGEERALTSYQFALLDALADHAGRVMSRDALMDLTKGEQLEAFDRSVDVHISRIRAAIEDDVKKPRRIITVRGAGYVFAREQDRA